MITAAIILAGGEGARFGGDVPKQFLNLNGKPIIKYSVDAFRNIVDYIIIVCQYEWFDFCAPLADAVIAGGKTRNESTYNGLLACPEGTEYVLIHDAVRPFVDSAIISRCVNALQYYDAVDTTIPIADTIVTVNRDNEITDIPVRSLLRRGQTPQAFKYKIIKELYRSDLNLTDDIGILFKYGIKCGSVEGSEWNIKITTPADLFVAEKILQYREAEQEHINVTNKNVLLFGGSGGIGSEVLAILKANGASVFAPDISTIDLLEELPVWIYKQTFDVIINCAGIIRKGFDDYEKVLKVNFLSNVKIIDLAIKTMPKGGNIVLVGSSSAMHGRKDFPIYSASKAALNNFTEAMGDYLKDYNIRITCINPARTNTTMTDFLGISGAGGLDPKHVARVIVGYCDYSGTGQVFNIRKGVNDVV